jgi:hypothetical protein
VSSLPSSREAFVNRMGAVSLMQDKLREGRTTAAASKAAEKGMPGRA